ncbi:pH-response regulator protein palA/rim20 [Gaertneriomyces sp. JEL0708]|nr:pH-response regulator protein palA/rim20 [Gaertneriomyces sp. JEL0708]
MAGLSTSNMLPVEFKRTERLSLSPPLKSYIASQYAEDPDIYIDDFRELESLRGDIMQLDVHPASLNKLLKYWGQLTHVGAKFPIDENHIKICFSWYGSLGKEKDRKLGGKAVVSSFNMGYEKACVLYNVGAMYSQLGIAENRASADGLKRASQYFMQAAGVFQHIQEHASEWQLPSSPDFQPAALTTLINLMLAQAQECFWYKSVVTKMKSVTIARLAVKVAEYYDLAYQNGTSSGGFTDHWLVQMQIKSFHFQAAANFRKSAERLEAGRYGEEIGYLIAADKFVKKAMESHLWKKASEYVQMDLKSLEATIQQNVARANKDNDIVYMETIPRPELLEPIDGANMVNPLPVPTLQQLGEIVGTPMFAKLVPFSVHQSVSVYQHKKDAVTTVLQNRLNEATAVATSTLASLNLPASIEALEQPMGLPPALLQHSQEVRSQGGAHSLRDSWETISSLARRDSDILDEAIRQLDEEEREDDELRVQFATRWTRTRSSDLNRSLRDCARVYRNKLEVARKSDETIAGKMEKHMHFIESLSLTREELEASIPSSTAQTTPVSKDPNVQKLKMLINTLNEQSKRRQQVIEEVKRVAAGDDISTALIQATNHKQQVDEEDLFAQSLAKYEAFQGVVEDILREQEQILQEIRASNDQFMAHKQTSTLITHREQALQNLDNAYKAFKEISGNMSEGVKFYTEFQGVLEKFRGNCRDFVVTRRVDRKDAVDGLMRAAANNANVGNAPPNLPPRHIQPPPQQGQYAAVPQPHYQQHYHQFQQGAPAAGLPPPGAWNPNIPLQYSTGGQQPGQQGPGGQVFTGQLYYNPNTPSSMPPPLQPGQGGYMPYGV